METVAGGGFDREVAGRTQADAQDARPPERLRASEVISSENLAHAVQQSVGGDDKEAKAQRVREETRDLLRSIYQQNQDNRTRRVTTRRA